MKLCPFYRILLTAALVGVCTTAFAGCAGTDGSADVADSTADDTTADTSAVTTAPTKDPETVDETDIITASCLETYFSEDSGGWTTDAAYDTVSGGVMKVTGGSSTRTVTHSVSEADAFDIEFRVRILKRDGEAGFKYEYNGQRIMMYLGKGNTSVRTSTDSRELEVENGADWNTYRLSVVGSQAEVYLNGVYQFTYNLQPWSNSGGLTFFVNSSEIEVDYVKFNHHDASISITSPAEGTYLSEGGKAVIKSVCDGAAADIPSVDYYANGTYIGTANAADGFALEWADLRPGQYVLTAKYGEYTSRRSTVNIASKLGDIKVDVKEESVSLGTAVKLSVDSETGVKAVVYYVNGSEIEGNSYTANTVGKNIITAKVTYGDGSYVYAAEDVLYVSANTTVGAVLQQSYIAEYTARAGSTVSASDGMYALEVSHSAAGVTYTTIDGTETYPTALGSYRLQVDGGVCDVYYNGAFAFSFVMPLTDKANGINASGVSGLALSGINATRCVYNSDDGAALKLSDITQDYAAEFAVDGKQNFTLVLTDGVYKTDLTAEDGQLIADTYPNGKSGTVERAVLFAMPDGKHIWRVAVSNGIAQIFIDNAWKASLRLPVEYAVPYIAATGLGDVYIRETGDEYIYSDSFDNAGEFESASYWSYHEGVLGSIADGVLTLTPNPEFSLIPSANFADDFSELRNEWSGGSFTASDGIMTVSTTEGSKSKTTSAEVTNAEEFTLEMRMRIASQGSETGFKLEYSTNRIMCYFRNGNINIKGAASTGDANIVIDTTQWHDYKFVVTKGGKCEVFIDGESKASLTLQDRTFSKTVAAFFVKSSDGVTPATIEVDSVSYAPTGEVAMAEPVVREAFPALIKAYALNPTVTATVKVDSAEKGGVYLTARYSELYRNLLAGYNFENGEWEIVNTSSARANAVDSYASEFPFGTEVKLELVLDGTSAVLYVNGERMVSSSRANANYYGNVGIAVGGTSVSVLDFGYTGTGRALPGAVSFVNDATSPDVFEYEDGHLYVISGSSESGPGTAYESVDDGYTWRKTSLDNYSSNTIRLASGTIVWIIRRNCGNDTYQNLSYVSTDNGETFEGPFPVQTYLRNRITMNNKLTEASNGRLFFASGESGDGVENEGGVRVFYSDDEGRTWKGSNILALDGTTVISGDDVARMAKSNTGVNCQESRVVEMPDGTFRLYHRTDEGFLYYSVSTDNGATWTAQMWASEFISVLSAFNIERDPETGYYYMAWEYNNKNDSFTIQQPRTRVGLAVSYDGMETWEYIGDIQEAGALNTSTDTIAKVGHMNIGIRVTGDAIYVTTVYQPMQEDGTTPNKNYMVRIDKDSIKTTKRFTNVHALVTAAPDSISEAPVIDTMLVIDSSYTDVYAAGKLYSVESPMNGYIPASIVADYVGAVYTSDTSSARMTLAARSITFTVGETAADVDGTETALSAAPVMGDDGVYVPVDVLFDVFGRELTVTSNGATVSLNSALGIVSEISAEAASEYLPKGVS